MIQDNLDRLIALIAIMAVLVGVWSFGFVWLTHMRDKKVITPIAEEAITKYDALPPGLAVAHAWSEAGNNPHHHMLMQDDVRAQMPLLARALDRLVEE